MHTKVLSSVNFQNRFSNLIGITSVTKPITLLNRFFKFTDDVTLVGIELVEDLLVFELSLSFFNVFYSFPHF